MIKKTLYFGNPAYLSSTDNQLVIKMPEVEKSNLPGFVKNSAIRTIPIEDIGIVVLDNKQITISQNAISQLLNNNAAIITCDDSRMPVGLLLPLEGNSIQSERFRDQIEASLPLKKQLWQQTVQAKIIHQAVILKSILQEEQKNMIICANSVRSGDPDNYEARAAAYYWSHLFPAIPNFTRNRNGIPPNNLLNYGYALLRAIIARALVGSGMLPTLGIHHKNRYNAYCLADDIMEPYRPFVDKKVLGIISTTKDYTLITHEIKVELLKLATEDVIINGQKSPLQVAATITTASLYKCFSGELKKVVYPDI
ncbi:MAG: type II CRISPR-associated endonuclease Cas1 [Bacteroidales bacterium]|nr:type II CRISPR-associated endonuclease Cas1 [Bacteroidales bacterium]